MKGWLERVNNVEFIFQIIFAPKNKWVSQILSTAVFASIQFQTKRDVSSTAVIFGIEKLKPKQSFFGYNGIDQWCLSKQQK